MEQLQSVAGLKRCSDQIRSTFSNMDRFPSNIFRPQPALYSFLDYGYVTGEAFFALLKNLCATLDEGGFTLIVTSPDPESYYFNQFHWLPAASFSRNDDFKTFAEFVTHDPGGSPADAIAYRADKIAIVSDKSAFAAYGTRSTELVALAIFRPYVDRIGKTESQILMDSSMAYDHISRFGEASVSRSEFDRSWTANRP